ncbi:MAG: FAD-dependent oxidoreductase [Hyphomonas sp.]|uniref:NAD(P)/FAD-dependent oxidoreductase n=1 Tax=Hyphomonas sp. TaxID=87 RepID=UPI0034A022A6
MADVRTLKADLCVIGAGSGGLSAAAGAAMLGLKVVLFEKHEMGGDCLNYGCVPSKALLSCAKSAHAPAEAAKYGVTLGEAKVDWEGVKAHIRKSIETIAPVDSQERFEGLGCTVIREEARFEDPHTVVSGSVRVKARRIIVATGSRAFIPPIPGLAEHPYLTNETIFSLPAFPEHLIVLGGGPIGLELAQAFVRLGAKVTVLEMGRALARADAAHAQLAVEALRREGVSILEGHKAVRVSGGAGRVSVHADGPDGEIAIEGSHLLVALGRRAVLEGLGLDKGGVKHTPAGITVGDTLRSRSNPRVWALGDAAGREQFTHVAGWHASVFIRRAFFKQGSTAASLPVPSVTYTSPEIAQIGLTEAEARAKFGGSVKTSAFPFHDNDRAIAEGRTLGEAKLVLHKGTLVGASIAGDGAGDILQLVSVAMSNGLKLTALTNFISPYPTRAEAVKRAASAYFTPSVFGKPARTLVGLLQRIP